MGLYLFNILSKQRVEILCPQLLIAVMALDLMFRKIFKAKDKKSGILDAPLIIGYLIASFCYLRWLRAAMKKVLVSVIALGGAILLAGCVVGANIDPEEFKKVERLCDKNNGLGVVSYLVWIDGTKAEPRIAYCKDGARFDVPESMKSKK